MKTHTTNGIAMTRYGQKLKRKRLEVERCESRTMLSVTFRLAMPVDEAVAFESGFSISERTTVTPERLPEQNGSNEVVTASEYETDQPAFESWGCCRRSANDPTTSLPGVPDVQQDNAPPTGLSREFVPPAIANFRGPTRWLTTSPQIGGIDEPLASVTGSRAEPLSFRIVDNSFAALTLNAKAVTIANHDRLFTVIGSRPGDGFSSELSDVPFRPSLLPVTDVIDNRDSVDDGFGVNLPSKGTSSSKGEGGLVELFSDQPDSSHDAIVSYFKSATTTDGNLSSSRQLPQVSEIRSSGVDAAPDTAVRAASEYAIDRSPGEDRLRNDLRPSNGGLADVDSEKSERSPRDWLSHLDPLPDDDSWWGEESGDARDSIARNLEQDQESSMAREEVTAQRLPEESEAEDAIAQFPDADTDIAGEEGGLIEIVALANTDVDAPPVDLATPSDATFPKVEAVRMDTGVGLYHVFEVAVASSRNPGEPILTTGDGGSPLQASAVETRDAAPVVEDAAAASENAGTGLFHAASVSSIAAAASLVFMRKRKTEPREMNSIRRTRLRSRSAVLRRLR